MVKVHSAGGVVLNRKGQVLVVNQKGRTWSLPKGHVEKGESVLSAARREIHEESGVSQLRLIGPLGSYERTRLDYPRERKKLTFFLFETDRVKLKPLDPDNPEARWVDAGRVGDLLSHPKDRAFFERIRPLLEDGTMGR